MLNAPQIFPRSRTYGESQTENLMFHEMLKEFSLRVSIIYNLQTSGDISQSEAFLQLAELWQQLEKSANSSIPKLHN
ncbi:DUF7219 family protein [Pseudanabaena sp. Chao 1811]|uniref:DUF7219 family protein n=1 Tax=Pseudanabaena sp. Chao 1811 TaxID=2963092 RepID=UPI0022F3EEDC|nr:hypothetical protein [Pseudanabaena sp. Chao 1811]